MGLKGAEFRRHDRWGEVDDLHAEAQVRFVGAVGVERLVPGHADDWRRHVAGGLSRRIEHRHRDDVPDVLLGDERRLEVELENSN